MQTQTRTLPLSQPWLTDLERRYVHEAIDDGWISGTGPHVKRFEAALAARFHRHAVACANGTLAIEAVLRALGIGPGDEVLVPALTFGAPAAVVKAVGASVVFVDVDEATWTLDPREVQRKWTPKTRAVIAVDVLGHPCDYDALLPLSMFKVFVVEDAAEAHGATYKGKECGTFGVAATFSFHPNKCCTAGEGGVVLTHHDQLAERARLHIHHGMTPARPYWHEVVGSNYRLNNLSAAVGLAQVERWDALVAARRQVYAWYDAMLPDGVTRRPVAPWATEGPWLYTVTHPERDRLLPVLRERGIDARAIWTALPDNPAYRDDRPYPVARRLSKTAMWLPTSGLMTEADVAYVCETLHAALKG